MGVTYPNLLHRLLHKTLDQVLETGSSIGLVVRFKFIAQVNDTASDLVLVCVHVRIVLDIVHHEGLSNPEICRLRFQLGHMCDQII